MIYTIRDYFDDTPPPNGPYHVKEFVVIDGTPPDGFPKFVGVGSITIQLHNQIVDKPFTVSLNANSVEEAFKAVSTEIAEAKKMIQTNINQLNIANTQGVKDFN